jgi:hypothetical protein
MRHIFMTFLIASAFMAAGEAPASAKGKCTEGTTASGACVNPHLARLLRRQTILLTQPKLSFTAPPVLPGDDEVVQPPRQIFETLSLLPPRIR